MERSKSDTHRTGFLEMLLHHRLLLVWTTLATTWFFYTYAHLSKEAKDLVWLYFQPLVPPVLMLWLWSINVSHFDNHSLGFDSCFRPKEKRYLMSNKTLVKVSLALTNIVITLLGFFAWTCSMSAFITAKHIPFLTYACVLLLLLFPAKTLHRSGRLFFCSTTLRVLLPVDSVSWADFLLADMLTSLAKSLSDLDRAFCRMSIGPTLAGVGTFEDVDSGTCSSLSWHALLALCWPFIVRFVQCIRVYSATGNQAQVFNALKYFSSVPAQLLSAVEHEYHVHDLGFAFKHIWLLAMAANSLYSAYWDIEQDWDMPWLMQHGGRWWGPVKLPALRSDAMYSTTWYIWAAASNLLLRMTWTYRLMGHLEAQRVAVLLVACLEVYRRHQWAYIRVETELRRIGVKTSHSHPLLDS